MSLIGIPHASLFIRDPFTRDFDQLLNTHLNSITNPDYKNENVSGFFGSQFNTHLDVSETDKGYVVHADVPGVKKEEVDVHIKDGVLTISGERSNNKEIKDGQRHVVERSYGKFSRSIRLPEDANADKVTASMENGVLELVFEKKPLGAGYKKIALA
ncbi:hypothetical protein HDU83_000660 [Entophlyctis luteolus]|nr:hypothetical protein HDU82_006695 [Entophlyctis luteolus]KAJ3349277.1 hypothetical protein HDU83_000660 [Entophlyctis luteolus]KAJ3394704.1 hypothetical protein HDU84_006847 [Entophlyctis sp. JEL0112]